ncbi:MAG: glucose-6-phosphate isomerase [Nitriliruptoraceae bacterium]
MRAHHLDDPEVDVFYEATLGPLHDQAAAAIEEAMPLVPRLWERDHTLWDDDPTEISDRLGWLDAVERADQLLAELGRLSTGVVADGITDVLLVGMGGSSLYPEVLARCLGPAAGAPRLTVLDSTDPAAVLAAERSLPWSTTLVVPASKSGTTIEMACLLERYWQRLVEAHGDDAGRFVLPITDPGSALDARAREQGWRGVVHGQPAVGGRFSALTPFGLVPAALLGLDLTAHLAPARELLEASRWTHPRENTPATLGAIMAAAVRAGRDKLTLLLPEAIESFGAWIEQLVAESTGKHGLGIVPVLGETPQTATFGADRLVVAFGDHPALGEVPDGVPTVALDPSGPDRLAAEVVRFEVATAIAGALLGINPFDQPNVAAAKEATARVLERGEDLPAPTSAAPLLETVSAGDVVALLGFVAPGSADEDILHAAAARLRRDLGVPVTVGIGPRYLHSTGQLHKGGSSRLVALLTVGEDPTDAAIPGRDYTFSRLKRAQAAGDLHALEAAGRRVGLVELAELRSIAG